MLVKHKSLGFFLQVVKCSCKLTLHPIHLENQIHYPTPHMASVIWQENTYLTWINYGKISL